MWEPYVVKEGLRIPEFFSFFERYLEPESRFSGEVHNFWECLYVERGRLCVSADERVYALQAGDLIFHKPMEFHKFYVEQKSDANIFVCSFRLEGELAVCLENKVVMLCNRERETMERLISCIRAECPDAEADAEHFKHYLHASGQNPIFLQMLRAYLYQLFLPLTASEQERNETSRGDAEIFKKAVNYMEANVSRMLSVRDIAEFCNVSQSWLKRIFERFAGVGIHKYFLQMKMSKAAELLQEGVSVTETAERLGFSSQAYFSAAFRRETGSAASAVFLKK